MQNYLRFGSPVAVAALLSLLFWLKPDLTTAMLGVTTPEGALIFIGGPIILLGWIYTVIQGYPLAYGNIGTSGSHTIDSILSALPAVAAIFGLLLSGLGFHPMSTLTLFIAAVALLGAVYDLWIVGGAASRINRLTDEIKTEK